MYRGGRRELARNIAKGEAPDEFLYGLPEVRDAFPSADFIESDTSGMLLRRTMGPFELLTARLGFGLFFSTIILNWKTVRRARVIVGTTDSTGVPFLLLKGLGLIRARVVMISQGLHSLEENASHLPWAGWLSRMLSKCLRHASAIIVLGEGDNKAIRRTFSHCQLPEVITIQFGVDHRFWTPSEITEKQIWKLNMIRKAADPLTPPPGKPELPSQVRSEGGPSERDGFPDEGGDSGGYVLTVGSDQFRDYATLISAIGDVPLRLVTRLPLPAEAARPTIEVLSKLSWPELRTLYQKARFVVTPLKDQPRESGHSATLQAMACGKAVILSDTAGLWDREKMKHGETCYLVEPGNPPAMRAAIDHLWSNPREAARIGANARALVLKECSSAGFGKNMAEVIGRALNNPD